MFELRIKTDNDAFADLPQSEVARILTDLAERVRCGGESDRGYLFDLNGARVGEWSLDTEPKLYDGKAG
jgi:hypothetical protein